VAGALTYTHTAQRGRLGVYKGQIYVGGGEIRHRDYWATYTAVESFDPKSDTWTRHAPMPMPRHGLAGDFVNNHFHLVKWIGAVRHKCAGAGDGYRSA